MNEIRLARVRRGLKDMGAAGAARFFSAPGRTELGGNHTDHQNGRVLAAAVALDALGAAAENEKNVVRICSAKYAPLEVALDSLAPRAAERGSSAALVRGVLEYLSRLGCALRGFDMFTENNVPAGSGLSSSAAFEVLIAAAAAAMADAEASPLELARAGKYAENVHFGKPCGLMDQLASALGGVAAIDFGDPARPVVRKIDADFRRFGHELCIIDTGAYHESLTGEYAAVPAEMLAAAKLCGADTLSGVEPEYFWSRLGSLRGQISDRALLRAAHFFGETERAAAEADALECGDFGRFLRLMRESGLSSWTLLQNVYPAGASEQPAALALALCEKLLGGRGACRIHGGGFAGTVQAIVPLDMLGGFREAVEGLCGGGSCRVLELRREGGAEISIGGKK